MKVMIVDNNAEMRGLKGPCALARRQQDGDGL